MDSDQPPFHEACKALKTTYIDHSVVEEYELPSIDINHLKHGDKMKREMCVKEMAKAASEWGFFQVVNHGIPLKVLDKMQYEQMKIFHQPFNNKAEDKFLNLPRKSYHWGNPSATSLKQFSWSEAIHMSLKDVSRIDADNSTFRSTIEEYATTVAGLAEAITEVLANNIGLKFNYFKENCPRSCSYIRLNRYPPCPDSSKVFGLVPHTDSDFITIVYQSQIGGLQLLKNGRWFSVTPNPQALVINIGDLFQALSNGTYNSIEHRVVAPRGVERLSVAYFYCPTDDTVIESYTKPPLYKKFSYREYRQQIQADVRATGDKAGLLRFLL